MSTREAPTINEAEILARALKPGGPLESVRVEMEQEAAAEQKKQAEAAARQRKDCAATLETTREAAREARDLHFAWAEGGVPLVEAYVAAWRAYKTAERGARRLDVPIGESLMDFGLMAHAADSKTEEGRALRARVRRVAEALSWGIFS